MVITDTFVSDQLTQYCRGKLTPYKCQGRKSATYCDVVFDLLCHMQQTDNPKTKLDASGLSAPVNTVQFVTCLAVFNRILSLSNGVNESLLAATTLTIADSDKLTVNMVSGLRDVRQNGWLDVWREIEEKCQNVDLDASQFEKCRNAPKLQSTYIFFTTAGHRLPTHEVNGIVIAI
jgi:hypothetical protein